MQTINIDINDSGRIMIEDRVYYPADNGMDGMLENPYTSEIAILKKCDNRELIDLIETFECDVLSEQMNVYGFRYVIYPRVLKKKDSIKNETEYFLFTELPGNAKGDTVHQLSKSLYVNGFSIYSRIMAAIHLAEVLTVLEKYIGKNILSIRPEHIYVNVENGEIYIWIEQWLKKHKTFPCKDEFGFSPEWYEGEEKEISAADFGFFAAYAIFRLLCNDDPFDGSDTLLQFPLLTQEAISAIRANKYGFALAKGPNCVSEYTDPALINKWRGLPMFLRREFERNFTAGVNHSEERTGLSQWLKIMQKMRDCLVYVNGQFRFCDPDVSNKVMFMVIDEYKIPVWPKKAIYWYHVNIPMSESKNGVIAGVTVRDGHYYLTNLSGNVWGATLNNTSLFIHPEREIELVLGLTIQLENGKTIRIVDGLVDEPDKMVNLTNPDMRDSIHDFIGNNSSKTVGFEDIQNPDTLDHESDGKEK